MPKRKNIKVTYRKLGKERAWGQAHLGENHIEVDPRMFSKKTLRILIHEHLHILNPEWSETKVDIQSKKLSNMLWKERYRRIEK